MSWVAAAVAGAAVVGGVASSAISSSASKSAAQTQANAARDAAQIQSDQWDQTQANLSPYLKLGTSSINPLLQAMGYTTTQDSDGNYSITGTNTSNALQQTFSAPTEAQAQATPGYQFTLNQGLKATQNSAAARGLGTSGAALKGASTYATGLADSTYNDVYNRALQTFNTNYTSAANNASRLQGLVSNGQNAAATNGSLGAATASNIGNTLTSAANASASGTIGAANALTSGINSAANGVTTYGLLQNNSSGTSASSNYGAVNASNPSGYNVGSNSYGFTV
jgi:hypothetical protein